MEHQDMEMLAEPAAAATRVKSPSYSLQLEDEVAKTEADLTLNKTDIPSFDEFQILLNGVARGPTPILDAYGHLLSRLRLLELIGANGILTDALVSRLQLLNDENERLLSSERANRAGLEDLEQRLEDQRKQTEEAETALHDAHRLLQQQENELAEQTKVTADLHEKLRTERQSYSRRTSDKSELRPSHRSSREDSNGDKDTHRRSEHRSHRSDSNRHHERESHRHERESSIKSSRRSESRRDDVGTSKSSRDHARVDRIREDEEDQGSPIDEYSYTRADSNRSMEDIEQPIAERRISINGAASKDTNGHSGGTSRQAGSNPVKIEAAQKEEEYEPEIDIGEDLVFEEEDAPTVKPAASSTSRRRSRSRSRSPQRHRHRESDHRSSQLTRSRSPSHRDRGRDEHSSKSKRNLEYEAEEAELQTSRMKVDESSSRIKSEDKEAIRSQKREGSASHTARNRNNMYGRLGLPISNGNTEGGKAHFTIRGAGRSSKK